jgi:hypothetical protein
MARLRSLTFQPRIKRSTPAGDRLILLSRFDMSGAIRIRIGIDASSPVAGRRLRDHRVNLLVVQC